MRNNQAVILKLQTALNIKGQRILQRTTQFYSVEADCPITIYYVEQAYWDEESQKMKKTELFHSTSQLQIILFMRDLLYLCDNKELPTDNEVWNEKRKSIDYYQTLNSEEVAD